MRSGNRISGIDIIGNVPRGTHFCQFYQTKEDLVDILIPYFKAGLENNEFCLWVLSDQLDEEKAREILEAGIPDVNAYLENGQIEIVPYTRWHVGEGALDPQVAINHLIEKISKALASGYDGLKYSGNDFSGYDKILNSVIGKYPVTALCTYPIDKRSAVEVLDIVANHQFALMKKEGKWEIIESSCQKNIMECKQAEKALQESEDRYKAIFDNSLDGIFFTIPDGTILAANPAAYQMFGMTEEEIIRAGRNRTVDTSDPRLKHVLEERARTGKFKGELNHRRKNGTIFPSEISSSIFKDRNGLKKGVIIIRDISERKRAEEVLRRSEERFRALVTASSEVVYRVSPDWSEMRQLYGRGLLANTERPSRNWLQEYVPLEDQPHVTAVINEAIRTKSTYELEHRVRLADGSLGWIFSRAVPILDANGEIVEWFGAASDITERKRVEEALRESEERLRLLGDNLPDSAVYQYVYEPDGSIRFLYFSTGIERLNGVSVQDVLRDPNTLYRQVPQPYLEQLFEAEAHSARELSDFDIEVPMRLPDGQVHWMRLHSRPRRLPDGRTIWNGVQTDITELKRAEKVLHENELRSKITEAVGAERRRFFDVLEALPVMITLLTPDHRIAFANRSFREKFGESGARHCYEYCFGRTKPCEFCEAYKVLKTGQPHHWEVTMPDGSVFDTYNLPFTDVDGSPMILEMDIDITERKAAEEKLRDSEEKYRNIVETATEGILITDDRAIITYANKKMTDMLGYTLEEGIGRPIWDFISEEGKTILELNLEERRQGINGSYELKLIHKDGSPLWAYISAKSLFDEDGKFIGSLSMLTDITERKEIEEVLANIEIARKQEIHHRIKNNLQVISSLLDLQAEQFKNREDIKDSEVLEAFRESQDRVISMALIHEELYRGGGFETLNFSPYIQELADTLFQTYRLGNIDISLNMDLEENLLFDMDTAVPLGIIINELVSNSLKHAFPDRKKGEIQIKLHREESTEFESEGCQSTGSSFTLTISDNGVGIPENLAIQDLDSLGMQLVTSLVDQLDGELELKKDNGTEFTIRFKVTERNE